MAEIKHSTNREIHCTSKSLVILSWNQNLPTKYDKVYDEEYFKHYLDICTNELRLEMKHSRYLPDLPTTVGSKSTNTARGTCFPAPVSLKNVLKESSPPPIVLSLGIWPSGWIPCSKQYNSQQALPIWTPAWPTWTEIHSRLKLRWKAVFALICYL
jgi:hypothetical protein